MTLVVSLFAWWFVLVSLSYLFAQYFAMRHLYTLVLHMCDANRTNYVQLEQVQVWICVTFKTKVGGSRVHKTTTVCELYTIVRELAFLDNVQCAL